MEALGRLISSEFARNDLLGVIVDIEEGFDEEEPIYIVGGFARGCLASLLHGGPVAFKDLDVVVKTKHLGAFMENIPETEHEPNEFGGFRWKRGKPGLWVDIWQLADTVYIKRLVMPATIESFLAGVDLNIDRLAYEIRGEEAIVDPSAFRGIRDKMIDLDSDIHMPDFLSIELARAVIAHFKTGYSLAPGLLDLLRKHSSLVVAPETATSLRRRGYTEETLGRLCAFMSSI